MPEELGPASIRNCQNLWDIAKCLLMPSILLSWIGWLYYFPLNISKLNPNFCIFRFSKCKSSKFSSVQFGRSVVSDSLRPQESQHTRPPCPSPTPGVHLNSCASSWWCHPAISSSVIPFSSCPNPSQHQSLFQWVKSWAGQGTGVSASASVLPMNTQGLVSFRMDWLDLLTVQGTHKSLL